MNRIKFVIGFLFCIQFNSYAEWQELNTGINDNFNAIAVKGNYGIITGDKGVYINKTSPTDGNSWIKYSYLNNSNEAIIFNQTKFYHCKSDSQSKNLKFYLCGQDTINKKAMIFEIDLEKSTNKIIYTGNTNSRLKKIDCSYFQYVPGQYNFIAVGDS